MDKKVLVVLLVVSLAVNLATVFTLGYFWLTKPAARPLPCPSPEPAVPEWPNARIVRTLGLSPEQIETIRKENEEMMGRMGPVREELFARRQELMSMLRAENIDRVRVDTLLEQIARLQVEHEAQVFERLARIKVILTPEQQEQLGGLLHRLLMERCPGEPHPLRRHAAPRSPRVDEGQGR